jgi:hypothetical protein
VPLLLIGTFFYLVVGCAATYEPPPKQPAGHPKPYKVFGNPVKLEHDPRFFAILAITG